MRPVIDWLTDLGNGRTVARVWLPSGSGGGDLRRNVQCVDLLVYIEECVECRSANDLMTSHLSPA